MSVELYEVYNLPRPPSFMRGQATACMIMTVRYELDVKRSTAALLDRVEFETCSKPLLGFCANVPLQLSSILFDSPLCKNY